MKTQILKLEIHDDIVSIRDKLAWQQTGRILLEFPQHRDGGLHRRLNRRLDLVLLRRAAERLGAQVAFLTQNEVIRPNATEAGIPVFQDLQQAHRERWKVTGPRKPKAAFFPAQRYTRPELEQLHKDFHPKSSIDEAAKKPPLTRKQIYIRAAGLLCTILLLNAIVWLCVVPRAVIHLNSYVKTQEITLPIRANPGVKTVQIDGEIPARRFSVIVKDEDQLKASGTTALALAKATGKVTFHNLTGRTIDIPAGSEVSSSAHPEIRFHTQSDVSLAAGFLDPQDSNPSTTVIIEADTPGSQANLPAGEIDTVLGRLGPNLSVTNPEPLAGGSEARMPRSTSQDKARLRERLAKRMAETAQKELERAALMSGTDTPGRLLSERPEISQIITEKFIPADIATPTNNLSISMQIEYQAWGVSGKDLTQLASRLSASSTPNAFLPLADTLVIESVTPPQRVLGKSPQEGYYDWHTLVRQEIQMDIDKQALYPHLVLRTPQSAQRILDERLALERPPQIDISPVWLPILPPLPDQFIFKDN